MNATIVHALIDQHTILWLFGFFFLKHFMIDFPMQPPYMYRNKGQFGHPGGLLHATLHAVVSFLLLMISPIGHFWPILLVCMAEGYVHYFVDWGKVQINRKMNWGPTNSEQFWWLLGLDQFIHYMTYLWMIAFLI